MKLLPKRKIILLALIFCFVFSSVFTETLAADHHNHECGEPFCLICLLIETVNSLRLASVAVFFVSCLVFSVLVFKGNAGFIDYSFSLVVLKVRFNT